MSISVHDAGEEGELEYVNSRSRGPRWNLPSEGARPARGGIFGQCQILTFLCTKADALECLSQVQPASGVARSIWAFWATRRRQFAFWARRMNHQQVFGYFVN